MKESAVAKNATVQMEGERQITRKFLFYNLDVIKAIRYRVNSKRGTIYRKSVNQVLKEDLFY